MDVVQQLKGVIVREMEDRYNFPSIPINDHEQLFVLQGHKAILVSFAEVKKLSTVLLDGSEKEEAFQEELKEDQIFETIRKAIKKIDAVEETPKKKTKKKKAKPETTS